MDLELKQYLDERFAQTEAHLEAHLEARLNEKLAETEAHLIEAMRNMQTELLRGFAAYSGSLTLRVRKVEADQSNLDAAVTGRVEILEKRLAEIEQRLGIPYPGFAPGPPH